MGSALMRVNGLLAVVISDRDGVPLLKVTTEACPELALRPSFLSAFPIASEQYNKIGHGKNEFIISMYGNYQVSRYPNWMKLLPLRWRRGFSTYVERMRHMEKLKESNNGCWEVLRDSKTRFLMFKGQKPLTCIHPSLTSNDGRVTAMHRGGATISWLTYQDLMDASESAEASLKDSVLLTVTNDLSPRFGIPLPTINETWADRMAHERNALLVDQRISLFLCNAEEAQMVAQAASLFHWHKVNRFCTHCGNAVERNAAGNVKTCPSCQHVHYPSTHACGIVLITDVNYEKALLVRQPQHPPGLYTCVAGFAEVGETIEETIRREVAEEVGLEVTGIEYMSSQHWPFPSSSLMVGCFATVKNADQNRSSKLEATSPRGCGER
ncbi:unnamed protein product [Darwinula stevensoni]|uniref:NAD(+) diphosphatase n=1 Tax=Darwinula stevensoni TaxID=69355 RepID=A0A7R8XFZ8_9CRUS|nr:unnamed protein product [Darwinula stevensoni]CAG0895565.1 unnamed protein product [Darwinula stevensoni]